MAVGTSGDVPEEKRAGKSAQIDVQEGNPLALSASGDWRVEYIGALDTKLRALSTEKTSGKIVIDVSKIERLDTAGAWLLFRTSQLLKDAGAQVSFEGMSERHQLLMEEVSNQKHQPAAPKKTLTGFTLILGRMGLALETAAHDAVAICGFLGQILEALWRAILDPRRLRITSLVHHLERTILDAVPIVALITFLIGGVVVRQGAEQLRQFGADIYTIDLLGISILREFGILLTAIMIAGRSGSAYTAHLGSMKIREEIDALRTLGLDPMELLILPRVLALVLGLPLITFVAGISGLMGGALVVWTFLDISPSAFVSRLQEAVTLWDFGVAFLKAPFMGLIVGIVGCMEGLKVSGSAESVGTHTTSSVVKSIFLVICADAGFAMFFTAVGI